MIKQTFCSSPWIHMKITSNGDFQFCRWSRVIGSEFNIWNSSVEEYFQQHLQRVRDQLVDGDRLVACEDCYVMDQYGKTSGRTKQLLKTGVRLEYWDRTLASSPWLPEFRADSTVQLPVDWQIDLGNFCNSACVFCVPRSSSRLAAEFHRIGWLKDMPKPSWVDDDAALDRFIDVLARTPNLAYLHFLGGETLITPGFRKILQRLISAGLTQASIGFTTNLTVWDDSMIDLLRKFREVNLGMSIECLDSTNDYVRWPSRIDRVVENLERWQQVADRQGWISSLRITPTVLTVDKIISLFEYAENNRLSIESCNFISEPEFMSPSVLPMHYRQQIISDLEQWIQGRAQKSTVNVRDLNQLSSLLTQEAQSYVEFLSNEPDRSHLLPDLARYLRTLDQSRGNSVFDYRPDYEQLLRSSGY